MNTSIERHMKSWHYTFFYICTIIFASIFISVANTALENGVDKSNPIAVIVTCTFIILIAILTWAKQMFYN